MGRNKVNLSINGDVLRALMKGKETWSERAEKYGVTKQAVSNWLSEGRMPPRALIELVRDLDLSPEQVEEILGPQHEKMKARKRWKITVFVDEPEGS